MNPKRNDPMADVRDAMADTDTEVRAAGDRVAADAVELLRAAVDRAERDLEELQRLGAHALNPDGAEGDG